MPNYKAKFNNHDRVDVLQEGDILLKQNLDGFKTDPIGCTISFFQKITVSSGKNLPGAYLSGHAAIYVGNDQVAEATGSGIGLSELKHPHMKHTRYIVYRSILPEVGIDAADYARRLTRRHDTGGKKYILFGENNRDGNYSLPGAFASLATTKRIGKRGAGLLGEVWAFCRGGEDGGPGGRGIIPDFFCSQFVFVVHELAMMDHGVPAFEFDPYSVDPKFYHKILNDDVIRYKFVGKYIPVHSDESWRHECTTSVLQAITSYENLKRNQSFQRFRSNSDASKRALFHLNSLHRACVGTSAENKHNATDHDYETLLTVSLWYTSSLSELPKFIPRFGRVSDIEAARNLQSHYGPPLDLKSTLLSELDKTQFFRRLRSVRKSWVNAMQ